MRIQIRNLFDPGSGMENFGSGRNNGICTKEKGRAQHEN
jgi:hypothetical protein